MSKSRNDMMFGNHKHPGDANIATGIPTNAAGAKSKVAPDDFPTTSTNLGIGAKLAQKPAARGKIIVKTQKAPMGLAAGGILGTMGLGGLRKTPKGFGKG